ncbi:hypothetical protein BH11MYX4_BH11MYX4_44250 [soil metagenome]
MRTKLLAASFAAFLARSVLSVAPSGCGSTGSDRFAFDARAGGIARDGAAPFTFTNETGWTVTLTRATVTIGPVYLNVVAPLRDDTSSWVPWLGVRRAYGDDDHLGEGREAGEVLAQVTFDALSPGLVPFAVQGTMAQDQVRTAEIWLWPPPGVSPETVKIDAAAVDFAGEATRADARVRFRGTLVLDDAWTTDARPGERSAQPVTSLRKVRGIPTSFLPTAGGALEIRVDVRPLFRGADFSNLQANPVDEDGTKILVQSRTGRVTTDQVMRNVFQGLRASTGTYAVRWIDP